MLSCFGRCSYLNSYVQLPLYFSHFFHSTFLIELKCCIKGCILCIRNANQRGLGMLSGEISFLEFPIWMLYPTEEDLAGTHPVFPEYPCVPLTPGLYCPHHFIFTNYCRHMLLISTSDSGGSRLWDCSCWWL